MKVEELINYALQAQKKSYSPYSKFKVGACVLLKDNHVVLGANIENASYPLSCCAERVALFSTYMQGYKKEDIVSITIVSGSNNFTFPCGACRQVISELAPKDALVYCVNNQGKYKSYTVEELLPYAFSSGDMD